MSNLDCFALLNESRRPWMDPATLKKMFLELSAEIHPDRMHGAPETERREATERFSTLNEAYNLLRDPKERLVHLLELEYGHQLPDVQRIPPGTMDLFMSVGEACREIDGFLARKEEASSPMLKVKLFEEGLDFTDRLQALQAQVDSKRVELEAELSEMNAPWETASPPGDEDRLSQLPLERLEQIYRVYSYVSRWSQQIQERFARLAM